MRSPEWQGAQSIRPYQVIIITLPHISTVETDDLFSFLYCSPPLSYTLLVSIFSPRRVILELYLQPQEQCVANQDEWLNELAEHLRDSGISGGEAKTTVESLHKAGIVEEQVDFLHCLMHYRSYFMRPMLLEIKTVESIGPDIIHLTYEWTL